MKLTNGIIMPIDFRASVVHNPQRKKTVDRMLATPRTARHAASPATCGGDSLAADDEN